MFNEYQVVNFHAKKHRYSKLILRECVLWKAFSNKGYDIVRSRALFKLPCDSTLQKYVGKSTGEVGITPLINERLHVEIEGLAVAQERMCSLIIDEMSIQQKVIYDRQVDKIFGLVDMGPGSEQDAMAAPRVANHLLWLIVRGLSTPYVIPVGYFFTWCLKGEQLSNTTVEVIKLVEEAGFRVMRVLTDNQQTNVSLVKSLSDDSKLFHVVPTQFV